jgi:hypothetical protein
MVVAFEEGTQTRPHDGVSVRQDDAEFLHDERPPPWTAVGRGRSTRRRVPRRGRNGSRTLQSGGAFLHAQDAMPRRRSGSKPTLKKQRGGLSSPTRLATQSRGFSAIRLCVRIVAADLLDSNKELKKSKCFIWCRIEAREPLFLSLSCTEFVPNSQSTQCCVVCHLLPVLFLLCRPSVALFT